MKFVCLFSTKKNTDQSKIAEAMRRRAEYTFPEGVKLIAEYWSPSQPAVFAVLEAEDATSLMLNSINWLDIFEAQVLPVVEYEEGLRKLSKQVGRK